MAPAKRMRDVGPPSTGPDERDVLLGFLDYLREAVAGKADGLTEEQARRPGVPSGTSLLGLVKHLTAVERYWLLGRRLSNWAATFRAAPDDTVGTTLAAYRRTIAEANAVNLSWDDLADPGPRPSGPGRSAPSRRWTLAHLIEETARHAGHADILRELIDGRAGR